MVLSGCDSRNNREYLENRIGNEISRVYPTKNIEDLFKQFPKGFKIYQSYVTDKYIVRIELYSDMDNTISGTIQRKSLVLNSESEQVAVEYRDGKYIFSDEQLAKKLWPKQEFLFQRMTMNREFLSQQQLLQKSYSFANGDFELVYHINNFDISQFLGLSDSQNVKIGYYGSNSNPRYYYTVTIVWNGLFEFNERISE